MVARARRLILTRRALLVPTACPVWALHAADDAVVPLEQATSYVAKARAAV